MGSYSLSHMTILSRGIARWRNKQKLLYLYYHSAYGNQLGSELPWGSAKHKVIQRFDHILL